MQVRTGAPTGATGDADLLPCPHELSGMDERPREVRVQGRVTVTVLNRDDRAVAVVARHISGEDDDTVSSSAHVERPQNPDVEPGMPARSVASERRRDRSLRRP